AEPDALSMGLCEAGALRVILAAPDDVHRQARHPELLLAGIVELDQLGDRRHLAQQPEIIEAALFDRTGRPLRRGRPAELALDLVDELLDPARRRPGLLLLNAKRRSLVFVIAEPEVQRGIDQQHEADQRDEESHIFAEEPPARATC